MGIAKRSFSPIQTRDVAKSSCEKSTCDPACQLHGQKDIRIYLTSQPVKSVCDDDSDLVFPCIFDDVLMLQTEEMEAAQALFDDEERAAMAMGHSFGINEIEDDADDYELGVAASKSCQVDSWQTAAEMEAAQALFEDEERAAMAMGHSFGIDEIEDDADDYEVGVAASKSCQVDSWQTAAETEAAQALFENAERAGMAMGYSFGIDELEDYADDYEVGVAASESCQVDSWEYVVALNKSADLDTADEDSARIMGLSFDIGSDAEVDVRMEPDACCRADYAGSLMPSPSTPTGDSLDTGDPGAPSTPKRSAPDDKDKHTSMRRAKRPRTETCEATLDKITSQETRNVDSVAKSN